MKTSVNWLKRYVGIPWSPRELADKLTVAGLEDEGIESTADLPPTIVVAHITSREKHPNADRLSVCTVDDGSGTDLQVICGAPNCDSGAKVALAKVGTEMPDGGRIDRATLRGVESFGMICSRRELKLGDDHSGILVFPKDAPVGTALSDYLKSDFVVDWEVTPNRPDWLSHVGIAREIAAISNSTFSLPETTFPESSEPHVTELFSVEVQDKDLCPRYTGRIINGVKIGPSPEWMQELLYAVGSRPINNVVDITNYVLLECGQPLHAFDLSQLSGDRIVVRRAAASERMSTLDDQEHELTEDTLLIADSSRGVALAGVMGGKNSVISETTTDILIESAAFDASNIRSTSKQLGLATESSYRFERGVDISMVEFASARAAHLICKYAGGTAVPGIIDVRRGEYVPPLINCRFSRVNRILGFSIPKEEITSIFTRLGLEVSEESENDCTVSIPSFRLDLTREIDLIEEVARIYGLNNIPAAYPSAKSGGVRNSDAYFPMQRIHNHLMSLGLSECKNYTLVSSSDAVADPSLAADNLVTLKNPLSQEQNTLRPSLLPSMVKSVGHNVAHGNHDLRLFEMGRVFSGRSDASEEHYETCIVLTGRTHPERFSEDKETMQDFYDLKGMVEDLMEATGITDLKISESEHPEFESGACVDISAGSVTLGFFGRLAKGFSDEIRTKNPIFSAIIDIDAMLKCQAPPAVFQALPLYPAVTRDVAFAADENLTHQTIESAIAEAGVQFVERIELVDIYRDEVTLGKNKKSMVYTLTYRSDSKTLTDEEVNQAQEEIRLRLVKKLNIELR